MIINIVIINYFIYLKFNMSEKEEEKFEDCNDNIPSKDPATNPDIGNPQKIEENNEKDKTSDNEEEPVVVLSEEEKEEIKQKIIETRKQAGELYKSGKYVEALNIYSVLLKDAKRAKLTDQMVILYCNKGICFNKLNDKDKALESFSEALKHDPKYAKALANRMLLYNSKEEYIEAYDDFKQLKETDANLWNNYKHMESELCAKAEVKKKQMTDEMLGKLKDLGNSLLGNFGISLDNFKMIPNGQGGYSVQYQNQK